MFEAYSVSVTLKLNNLVSPQLALLAKEMERLEGLSVALRASFRGLGAEVAGVRAITTATNATNRALERASVSAATLQGHLAAMRATAAAIPPIAPHLGAGGPRIPVAPGLPGGGGAGGGGGNGGGGWGGAGRHPGGFHGGNVHMGPNGVGFGGIGMAAGAGFVPLAMTAGGIWGAHTLYESAKALDTERARFRLFGMDAKQNAEAMRFVAGMRIYGSTQTENMKNFREAQGIFRESGLNGTEALEGAKLAAPMLAKIAFATTALDDESKARMRSSSLAMLRWVEMSGGLKSPQRFNELADLGWKLTQTSGGNVNWEQLRQFSAISGNAGRFVTPEGLAALEPIIGELKGSGAGTGLRTALNRITGIVKIPNQVAHELVNSGIWDGARVEWNKAGGVKKFNGNPFLGYEEFVKDPTSWYAKTMIPLYDKMKLSAEERGRQNSMLFGSTGGRLFTLIEQQMPTIKHSVDASRKALGVDASVNQAKGALGGKEAEFLAAWTDFKTTAGLQLLPAFSNFLTNSAAFLRGVESFMAKNASLISTIGTGASWLQKLTPTAPIQATFQAFASMGKNTGGATGSWGGETIRGGSGSGKQAINNTIVMPDGRVLAKVVTETQAKELSRPATGPRSFDARMQPQGSW